MPYTMEDTLCVRTRDTIDDILAANNSAAWFLQPRRARAARYLVCAGLDRERSSEERRPFLVVEISEVVLDPDASKERARYAICFERYALLDPEQQDVLTGSQNPVRWGALEDFVSNAPDELKWVQAPEKSLPYSYSRRVSREPVQGGLSVDEAKKGLALRFGVPEASITITITA